MLRKVGGTIITSFVQVNGMSKAADNGQGL